MDTICLDCGLAFPVAGGVYDSHVRGCLRAAAPLAERKRRLLAALDVLLPFGERFATRRGVLGVVALELLAEEAGAKPSVVHYD